MLALRAATAVRATAAALRSMLRLATSTSSHVELPASLVRPRGQLEQPPQEEGRCLNCPLAHGAQLAPSLRSNARGAKCA